MYTLDVFAIPVPCLSKYYPTWRDKTKRAHQQVLALIKTPTNHMRHETDEVQR